MAEDSVAMPRSRNAKRNQSNVRLNNAVMDILQITAF